MWQNPFAVPATPGAVAGQLALPIPSPSITPYPDPASRVAAARLDRRRPDCGAPSTGAKNAIRASRAGEIAAVHVSVGQHVRHNDLLMEYVD